AAGCRFAAVESVAGGAGPFCTRFRAVLVCLRPDGRRAAAFRGPSGGRSTAWTTPRWGWIDDNRRDWTNYRGQLDRAEAVARRLNALFAELSGDTHTTHTSDY